MWRLISYGSSYVTHLYNGCLTYYLALYWIQTRVLMQLGLYYCRNIVMGCILWLSTLQSTTQLSVTMVLGIRSCLLLYKHVQSGIVTLRIYHQSFTLTMSPIKIFTLSHFFHVVRLVVGLYE